MYDGQTEAGTSATDREAADVLQALEHGAILIVPHVRAARKWAAAYDTLQREGRKSWLAARILPWGAWISNLWDRTLLSGADTRVRLNRLQEQELWSRIIRRAAVDALAPVAQQAQLCASALDLLGRYDTKGAFHEFFRSGKEGSADALTYRRWYDELEAICAQESLLPASHLEQELARLITAGKLPVGGDYFLAGLDDLTPAQQVLLQAVGRAGGHITHLPSPVIRQEQPTLLRCESPQAEIEQCAAWVRNQLEAKPRVSLAVVVPGLAASAADLARELRSVVASETLDVTRHGLHTPFEFSCGRSLRQLPMIHDALQLLRWCAGELPLEDAGALLRSRHLALMSSPEAGAALHTYVLQTLPLLRRTVSLQDVARAAYPDSKRLDALEREAQACRTVRKPYGWWTDTARELLQWAGWPGEETPDSDAFQAVERWNEALDQVASLDLVSRSTAMPHFLAQLESVAASVRFAAENRGAPVQVLTVQEAAGSTFDAMWFLHADADTWPPRQTPHPLLPWHLQQDLGMPDTGTARDETAASATLHRLTGSAGRTHFSYTQTSSEGARTPSPLVEKLLHDLGGSERAQESIASQEKPAILTTVPDPEPLPALTNAPASGGVSVLTTQSECGFKAFAEHRLFAKADDQPEAGLSPMQRGNHVHAVLQKFWDRVKNQRALKELTARRHEDGTTGRDALLRECIAQIFTEEPHCEHAWDAAYIDVQQRRLFTLLSSWLEKELQRRPFEVLKTEQEVPDVSVGPLRLKLRVDRVDRVTTDEGDGILLIDYKTGSAAARDWLGERPKLPQLPVYAVAAAGAAGLERVDGLAFGVVRIGGNNMKLEGVAAQPKMVLSSPRNVPDFPDQMEEWRRDLERLATAYANGDAALNPREFPLLCDRCSQRMLCRIEPATELEGEDMDLDQEDEAAAW